MTTPGANLLHPSKRRESLGRVELLLAWNEIKSAGCDR